MIRKELRKREVRGHLLGLGAALVLTCGTYAAIRWPFAGPPATLGVVVVLVCCRSSRDRLYVILFSALITLLMVSGSLVILTKSAPSHDVKSRRRRNDNEMAMTWRMCWSLHRRSCAARKTTNNPSWSRNSA